MTRALYVIGGAGTGKSTFMAELLRELGAELAPLEDLHALRVHKNLVTLRGHRFQDGVYLGVMRDSFPGSDGLDRVSGMTAEEWLATAELPGRIIGEGLTLGTRRFLGALHAVSELVVLELRASAEETERRCRARGSQQADTFVRGTAVRMANLGLWCAELGIPTMIVDTEDPGARELVLDLAAAHLSSSRASSRARA